MDRKRIARELREARRYYSETPLETEENDTQESRNNIVAGIEIAWSHIFPDEDINAVPALTPTMTVGQLLNELSKLPSEMHVVIDVNSDQCDSDRNVLDISEINTQPVEDDATHWAFIQAGTPA